MTDRILVTGATGGVGQLVVAQLLEQNAIVRVISRSLEQVKTMFADRVEVAIADIRQPETLPDAMAEVTHIICCTGTTAFPSTRWEFDLPEGGLQRLLAWGKIFLDTDYRQSKARNSPAQVDAAGTSHLVTAAPKDLKRFVFVSSSGVERKDQPPYSILNAFGVLDAKQQGEAAVMRSGLPYTIFRPGRLIDGPYTSYDLNSLIKATTHHRQGVIIATGDTLNGQTSRIDVASACVACLHNSVTVNKTFELINQGERTTAPNWSELFSHA